MNTKIVLSTKKYKSEGDLSWEYNPLHNIIDSNETASQIQEQNTEQNAHSLVDFDTEQLNLNMDNPVEVEVQPSYDGSVNLILNDDNDVPRIINSAFTVQEGWRYKRVFREQQKQTNCYSKESLEAETRLFRTTGTFLNISLQDIESGGVLKGGNYTFYIKYSDDDSNETNFVAESGIVSVFHGYPADIRSIRGTLADEKTDKQVVFIFKDIDTTFSKMCIYFKRAYSDLNGVLSEEYGKIIEPYVIKDTVQTITITGYEQTSLLTQDEFNVQYHVYDAVATSTQIQDRLFFGNVKEIVPQHRALSNCALNIIVSCSQQGVSVEDNTSEDDNIGLVSETYSSSSILNSEYYNSLNIYDRVGYWPEELYRVGVVFIYNNDCLSSVYPLKGCCFSYCGEQNTHAGDYKYKEYDLNEIFINGDTKYNTQGVFQIPDVDVHTDKGVCPLYLKMSIRNHTIKKLKELNIKGLFFVRQNRIPIALAQAVSIGISNKANIPVLGSFEKDKVVYFTESIISNGVLTRKIVKSAESSGKPIWSASSYALLCKDVDLNKPLQSMFCGDSFVLKPKYVFNISSNDNDKRSFYISSKLNKKASNVKVQLAYIHPEIPSRIINDRVFSSKAGSSADVKSLKNLKWDSTDQSKPIDGYTVRGKYTGYLGVTSGDIEPNTLYTIYTTGYIGSNVSTRKVQIELRANDHSPFTAISQRQALPNISNTSEPIELKNVYGGDCFTCTVTTKMCSNFLDSNAPLNDKIVKSSVGTGLDYNNFKFDEHNTSDWNAVNIGHYFTYKCLSNNNLGIRCINDQITDERALYGDVRSFYPFSKHVCGVSFKIPESDLCNAGLSATRKALWHFSPEKVPYTKEFFDNRIAFSNAHSVDSFQNNYRVFSNLSYTDIERKYGAIVKLIPLGSNLFCVFEHGCGIVPINEKALMSTTTGQSIHLYGSNVIQPQVTVVSPDYGSTWEESIITTPNGIYGVDTFAKKIWRYSAEGFSIISDMLVQRFLNDNINLTEYEQDEIIACRNVKTHFNKYKGDVMFTFYNGEKEWNLCYNERIQKWVTKYSWIPAYSANIYNSFVSTDKHKMEVYAKLDMLRNVTNGLKLEDDCRLVYETDSNKNFIKYRGSRITFIPEGYKSTEREDVDGDRIEVNYIVSPTIKRIDLFFGDKCDTFFDGSYKNTMDNVVFKLIDADDDSESAIEIPPEIKGDVVKLQRFVWNVEAINKLDKDKTKLIHWESETDGIIGFRSDNEINLYEKNEDGTEWNLYDRKWLTSNKDILFTEYVYYTKNREKLTFEVSFNREYYNSLKNDAFDKIVIDFDYMISSQETHWRKYNIENDYGEFMVYQKDPLKTKEGSIKVPVLVDTTNIPNNDLVEKIEDQKCIKFYTHGRAGNYSEINYFDDNDDNQIKPTHWYGKQEPFEFEFVVNADMGVQKIFNNLMIISNNAEPDSLEYTIVGDSYDFDKKAIYNAETFGQGTSPVDFDIKFALNPKEEIKFTTKVTKDHVLNQYLLNSDSKLLSLEKYGRRLGNMQYVEDKFKITLNPILYKDIAEDGSVSKLHSARPRDKWMKIRIRYKGDKLAVISAIQSLYTINFA